MSAVPVVRGRLRQIGKYTLGRRIGAGGMAAVFAARQEGPLGFGRLCAFKVMSSALVGDPAHERMFLREAGITARLDHPNIVRVYEVGEADSTLYIAMEFVHGASLRDLHLLTPSRLPLALSVAVIGAMAGALHAAHELRDADGTALDIVHQDVTPHNVMITYDGVIKLLDFGVARIGSLDASRTATVRGKPSYLAPEQLLGERIDRRTDVFALGAVFYELLTGRQPFQRRSELETFAAITASRAQAVADAAPEVPTAIAEVCEQALERDPEQRFTSAEAFARALDEACAEAGVTPMTASELAAHVQENVAPAFTTQELEREIIGGRQAPVAADVADLPTLSQPLVVPPGEGVSAPAVARRPPRWPIHLVGVALIAIAALVLHAKWPAAEWPQTIASASLNGATASVALVENARTDAPSAPGSSPAPVAEPSAPPSPSRPAVPPRVPSATPSVSASARATSTAARIAVRSTPWGTVFLDGVVVGDSPKVLTTTPGPHAISVRTSDGRTQSRTVQAKPDDTVLVQIVF